MKYIMFKAGDYEFPFIFPSRFSHIDVASMVLSDDGIWGGEVVSAGFVMKGLKNKLKATGDSMTLKVASRQQDTETINQFINGERD